MTIEEYVKSKEKFCLMPFTTVYLTITELIKDGLVDQNAFEKGSGTNVAVSQPKPKGEGCWGLYDQGNFVSDR